MPPAQFDIAIVGGGLVGASLAYALSESGLSCALIEAVAMQASDQPSYDDRTLALNHVSCGIIEALGWWSQVEPNATPIREIFVSEKGRPGRVHLQAGDYQLAAFGQVVQARELGLAAVAGLADIPGLSLYCPARLQGLKTTADQVSLQIKHEGESKTLSARLAVAADGARSSVRELLGIGARVHDYGQTAVISNTTPEKFHNYRAYERLTASGPLAILPFVEDRCGVVWTVPRGEESRLLECDDQAFMAGLQQRFGRRLGLFKRVGKRSSYPLYLVQPDSNIAQRTVLIGNAAHAIHPISAQGFNLGLRDVDTLARLLATQRQEDPGSAALLAEYDRRRRPDQQAVINYTHTLATTFSNPSWLMSKLRTAGMALHELSPGLKRRLVMGATGMRASGLQSLVPIAGMQRDKPSTGSDNASRSGDR